MKKRTAAFFLAGSLLLTGCQKTPEEKIVKEKGTVSVESYREAEPKAEGKSLRERVEAPESYSAQGKSEDGIFTMKAEAAVEVPEAKAVSVYRIGAEELTQDFIDRFTESFLGDAPIYDDYSYTVATKEDILKELEELKGYQAAGNEDPYGYRADYKKQCQEMGEPCDEETLDAVFNLQRAIDSAQEAYEEAPDKIEKQRIEPVLGANESLGEKARDMFSGVAEKDGREYGLWFHRDGQSSLAAKVGLYENGGSIWAMASEYDAMEEEGLPSREQVEEWAGDQEQAREMAERYISGCGLTDFSVQGSDLVVAGRESGGGSESFYDYEEGAWAFYFTRVLDGIPLTYEMEPGAAVESMDSVVEPWLYESCTVIVNKEGLCWAEIANLYRVEEVQVKNVELKSFSEIGSIFEKMIIIKNSGLENQGIKKRDMQVFRVSLGYMRIYDPGTDARSGLLVPVWDFFCKEAFETEMEGEEYDYRVDYSYRSAMTVNAVDGTVIDRGLGY